MADDAKSDKASAELRKLAQVEDGKKAMLDYEAQAAAMRARTEKLRALRLARDAAAPDAPAKTPARTSAAKKPAKASKAKKPAKASKAKSRPLSDWLSDQKKDGRRD
jgi:hypothetical protein